MTASPRGRVPRPRDETGGATVLVVAMTAVVVLVGASLAAVTGLVVDHRRVQAAADLAALAGAHALQRGGDACAEAARTAGDNDARLAGCRVAGVDVLVEAVRPAPRWTPGRVRLRATARAGPASG